MSMPFTPHTPAPYTGPALDRLQELRKAHMFQNYTHYYKEPFLAAQGHMQYLYDQHGKRHLDLLAGIAAISVGHCHPRINKVIREQCERLVHTSAVYYNEASVEYCAELAKRAPPGLTHVFLTNSGTESNDLALQVARLYTNSYKVVSLRNGYHGNAGGITNVPAWNHAIEKGFSVEKAAYPCAYRGTYRGKDLSDHYVRDVEELMETTSNGKIACWISEPIMGAGGIVPMPEGYLKRVYELARRFKGICISDEVQTGFGRTGTHYWDCLHQGAVPDMITAAKGIGNGLPLGAIITTKAIAESLNQKLYFNTFSTGPIQCRVGTEVLRIIDEEGLPKNAERVGAHIIEGLKRIADRTSFIGDVRGRGLMFSMEIVKDKESRAPDGEKMLLMLERLRAKGVLIGKGGWKGNVIRGQPPMCLTVADADFFLNVLEDVVSEIN